MMRTFLTLTFLVALVSCNQRIAPQQGLVGEYLFRKGGQDNSPYRNHASVVGAQPAKGHTGKAKTAFHLNGTDQYITIPSTPENNFSYTQDFSISAWISPDENQATGTVPMYDVIRKWRGDTQGYPFAIVYYNQFAHDSLRYKFSFVKYDGSTCRNGPLTSTSPVHTNQYVHLVFVREGQFIKIYLNSNLVSQTIDTTRSADVCGSHNDAPITVGVRGNMARFFAGSVDDLRFYNRALSQKEITLLHQL